MNMSNPLDKLFKDKLADHAQLPPANAWTRVEAGFSKKNNGLIPFRVAAAVLLVITISGTIAWLSYRNPSRSTQLTQAAKPNSEKPAKELQPSSLDKKVATQFPIAEKKKKTLIPSKNENSTHKVFSQQKDPVAQIEIPSKEQSLQSELVRQPVLITPEITAIAIHEKMERPIVLEYRLETIEPKSSTQEPVVEEAREKSGLRKVIDFALDAKNSSPLGDLRIAKEDLFAFNFKKEKQKNVK